MGSDAFDLDSFDHEGFYAEVRALREELDASITEADGAHLQKLERWGRACTALGLATAWMGPNPVSAVALALGRSTRWGLMHHCGHRGYDKVPAMPARYHSKVFARGWRRMLDWPDWMVPEAWIYEHNILHHQFTGEVRDPDLIERNADYVRESKLPMWARKALVAGLSLTWKPVYYAPNTMRVWLGRHEPRNNEEPKAPWGVFLRQCVAPYMGMQFVALPLAYSFLGPLAVGSALCNSLAAEALTNLHTFLVVGPNHAGDDLYRFEDRPVGKGEFFVRQVIGSVNYATGGDVNDWLHMWLNYQIEHHLFPDVPIAAVQRVQPKVKALCERWGVPYAQASVFTRFRKMVKIFTGEETMRRAAPRARKRATSPVDRASQSAAVIEATHAAEAVEGIA
jgi:fatty acid desaturase